MKYHMGLRHNRHMVRMVKTDDPRRPYSLGRPYGNEFEPVDNTERRRRILDQWGIPNQSPRRPESPSTAEELPRRSQSIYFHQLHDHEQELLTRRQHGAPLTRRDVRPGTKERIHLGRNHAVLAVESYPLMGSRNNNLRTSSPSDSLFAPGSPASVGGSRVFKDNFGAFSGNDFFTPNPWRRGS